MRLVTLVACVSYFGFCGAAFAADCNKGMLWPYVRAAGDCLTDAEIAAGHSGVYSGAVNTNVDVSAIKPETVPQSVVTGGSAGLLSGPLFSGGLFGGGPAPANPGGAKIACNKGYLWPFLRDPGDCLTAEERKTDKSGVFRPGDVAQVSATTAGAPAATAPAVSTGNAPAIPEPPSSGAAACGRSWLWPFVREPNDCPTDTEKKGGTTAIRTTPAASGGAQAQTSAPAPAPSASAASGMATASSDVRAQTSAPMPVSASSADAASNGMRVQASAPIQAPSTASCEKGWLWPFVRGANDCPTDTDKKAGGK